jgi:hypothetical protein
MVKNGLRTGFRRDIGVVLERFGFEVAGGGVDGKRIDKGEWPGVNVSDRKRQC